MYSTLPELSNSGPLCHNDKKAAREWAGQARYTQARLTKGGVCAAPAGQRSGVFVHRQRSGVLAFRQRWRAEVSLIRRDQHERTGSRWVRPSQQQRETVSTLHRRGRWGWGRTGSSRCSAAPGDLGQGPSVVRRYDREWRARVVTSPKTETQLERPEGAGSQRVGRGGRGSGGPGSSVC